MADSITVARRDYSLKLFFPTPGPMRAGREGVAFQQWRRTGRYTIGRVDYYQQKRDPDMLVLHINCMQKSNDQCRFILQIELYPIKRQKAGFAAIEM